MTDLTREYYLSLIHLHQSVRVFVKYGDLSEVAFDELKQRLQECDSAREEKDRAEFEKPERN